MIALWDLDNIVTIDMSSPRTHNRHCLNQITQLFGIKRRMFLAQLVIAFQMGHFHQQHCCLQLVESCIYPHHFMMVAHTRAMITYHTHLLGKGSVIGRTDSSFTKGTQVFAIVEAKAKTWVPLVKLESVRPMT